MTNVETTRTVNLQKLLAGAQLPALPQSAIRLLELSQNPDNGPAEFAVPIEVDPGLTGQVLKFVNSSYFGFAREIDNVKQAIALVGIRTIKNFALWSAVFSLMPNPKCGPFDLKSLWQDSVRRGLFSRALGKAMGMREAEDLFAGALLQDMAVPLLAKELAGDYLKLLEERNETKTRLSQLERDRFGWTHGEAAAQLCRTWNLPDAFVNLIEHHSDLDSLNENGGTPSQKAVAVSAFLPAAADGEWHEFAQFEAAYAQLVDPAKTPVTKLLEETDAQFTEFAPVLKLAVPTRSLVDLIQEATTQVASAAPTA
ncbi:MAG: HDOD domain-containing protein [Pirellulales bacterium]